MKSAELSSYNSAFRALTRLIDIGVLIVTPERTLEFISKRAQQLLHCLDDADRAACWRHARSTVEPVLERAEASSAAPVRAIVKLSDEFTDHQLELEVHRLLDPNRQLAGYLALVKDYDNYQRVEQSLRLAMQMHHTGRLYEALAHDLRQPIGAILIHLRILDEIEGQVVETTDHRDQFRESVTTIRSEIKELDDSLRLLLRELSPSDTEERVPLCEVMRSVARLIEPQVDKAGLTLDTEIPDEDVTIRGRRFRIKQAVLNLATNALEAMSDGTLTLRLRADDREACIEVVDEGPGIPDSVQSRMYERHFTTKEDGTGLGLHIVKQTAEAHGGQVTVESVLSEGTTFHFCLPLAAAADPASEAASTDLQRSD